MISKSFLGKFVISFIFDWLFALIGEEKVNWISMVAACTSTTAAIIIVDILNSRKKGVDRSDDIIKICRRILTTTTYMFCGMLHWLSFALAAALFDELTEVLGLVYNRKKESLDEEVEALIAERAEARKNKNWARADEIRDTLKAMNIVLEDTPQGVKWHKA